MESKHITAELVWDINVRTNSDTRDCCISGSALLADNKLILADHENSKVKLLNLQNSKVTSELKTSNWPWNVTSVTEDTVAVTIRVNSKIVFVKVTDTLKKDREMSVVGDCTSIIHNNGKLIVAFERPVKIEIMTLDGTVERKIEHPSLFQWPSHMAVSQDCKTIYVAEGNDGCVKGITLDGDVEAVYSDTTLEHPRGVTVYKHGSVLVCGENSFNILVLTPGLTEIQMLVDGLDYPVSLSYSHNTGMLFVGMWTNHMKAYQLS